MTPTSLVRTSPNEVISTFRIVRDDSSSLLVDMGVLLALSGGYYAFSEGSARWVAVVLAVLWAKMKSGQVLEESIIAVKGIGLQLTTTRGLSMSLPNLFYFPLPSDPSAVDSKRTLRKSATRFPLSTSNLFIPLESISDIVINEGIYGWRVIYYIVIIQTQGKEEVKLRIAFSELLPRLAELKEVWRGTRSVLFDEDASEPN